MPQVRNLSADPKIQDAIDRQLEGYNAAIRKVPFDPHADHDWRLGWQAQRDGRVLTERALRYLMR